MHGLLPPEELGAPDQILHTESQPPLPCACMHISYVAASRLQAMKIDDVSHSLAELHLALTDAAKMMNCFVCPKDILTAQQNVNALCSLFVTIIDSLRRIMCHFDELTRSESSPSALFYSQGVPQQAMTGVEYRIFVRNTLRSEIVGTPDDTSQSTLFGLVNYWEKRQEAWHQSPEYYDQQVKMFGQRATMKGTTDKESRFCFRAFCLVKEAIGQLDM